MIKTKPNLQQELKEQLRFETLLAEISARFVNMPSDRIDDAIQDAQCQICECLELDVSALWQWADETPRFLTITHLHSPPEGPDRPDKIDAAEAFPWVYKKMMEGEMLAFSTEDLPMKAARDKESRNFFGVKSSVVIPLTAGGRPLMGVLTFDTLRSTREWPEEILKQLTLVAQIFSNALSRKRSDEQLHKSEARLRMAADSAAVGLWELDYNTGTFWATKRARLLFGYTEDEVISMERFEASIHTDDLALVRKVIDRALVDGESVYVEYRLPTGDSGFKWISSCGKPYFNPKGKPVRLMGVSTDITERKQMEEQLRSQLEENERLRLQLERENTYLRKEIELKAVHGDIIGQSLVMRRVLVRVEQVAQMDTTVLIEGETGTGKELVAQAVHQLSARSKRPLVTVNCASLPPTLIESELFGREKGAYTGALTRMMGRFEVADGATLFLDEIGELPLEAQAKLLRVLEQGRFERLGSAQEMAVDVRIITATNHNLEQQVNAGCFRKDLYYRLNVFTISVPPLRERTEDIPSLVWYFVRQYENKMGKRIDHIPRQCMDDLQRYVWPGNVRELRNMIEHALIVSSDRNLEVLVPQKATDGSQENQNLDDIERRHIKNVLQRTGWRLSGEGSAAEILGLKRTTLQSKMKKLGIQHPR